MNEAVKAGESIIFALDGEGVIGYEPITSEHCRAGEFPSFTVQTNCSGSRV